MSHTTNAEFYIAGGTLAASAECYIVRQADRDLLHSLLSGEMCYVLTSRQMGKSSLIVRTAAAVVEKGGHSIVIDMTSLGGNVTPEQWYLGMLCQMCDSEDEQADLVDCWYDNSFLPPIKRFNHCLKFKLEACHGTPVVIFFDEIDAVRSLPFSSDEFFAAIREIMN